MQLDRFSDIANPIQINASIAAVIAISSSVLWWRKQKRAKNFPAETKPFQVLDPGSEILRAVYPQTQERPLADANIKYQQRSSGVDTKAKLVQTLEKNDWLLLLGKTGWGKTREAAEVAQVFNNEGLDDFVFEGLVVVRHYH